MSGRASLRGGNLRDALLLSGPPHFLRRSRPTRTIRRDDPQRREGLLSVAVGSSNSFDLIVLGGGTGGYSAAFRAGQLGLKVALIDDQPRLGGTCLIWGCIPTKAMLELAELYERMQHSADFGIPVSGDLRFDYATVAKRRDGIVDRLTKGLDGLAKKNKVELIRGLGTLQGGKKVLVKTLDTDGKPDGERPLDATDVILATGSPRQVTTGT